MPEPDAAAGTATQAGGAAPGAQGAGAASAGGAGGGTASTAERANMQRLNAMRQQPGGEGKPAEDEGEGGGGGVRSITILDAVKDVLFPFKIDEGFTCKVADWAKPEEAENNIKRAGMAFIISNIWWIIAIVLLILLIIAPALGIVEKLPGV